jgi:hypothetical protein
MIAFAHFCFTQATFLVVILTYFAFGARQVSDQVEGQIVRWALIAASGSAAIAFLAMGLHFIER